MHKGGVFMAQSKAHIKASNKYNKEHYSKIQANIGKITYNGACVYCAHFHIPKAQLISNAIRKYIFDEMVSGAWSDEEIHEIAEAFEMTDEEISKIKSDAEYARSNNINVTNLIIKEDDKDS